MLFKSRDPDIQYPTDLTVWQWAFEDVKHSPLYKHTQGDIAGFTNSSTRERLDFFAVRNHAIHLSSALARQYNLQMGDTVSIFSQNSIWYPVGMYAALRIGGKINGASPAYGVDEMAHALKTAETKVLLTVPGSVEVAVAAAERIKTHRIQIILLEGQLDGFTTLQELIALGRSYGPNGQVPMFTIPTGQTNKDLCGFLTFSSGTTGHPKAVMLSHQNVIAQCHQLQALAAPGNSKFLAQSPLFHISGLIRFLSLPVHANAECIMLPTFTMELFLQTIVDFQIQDLNLVPPLVVRLVRDPIVDKYDLSCIKRISCSAAPLSVEMIRLLQKKFPSAGFRQSYGMTEASGCLSTHPPEYYSYKFAHTSGLICASTVIKIIDLVTGAEGGPGDVGEIYAKGPQIAMGYLGQPDATAETFTEDGFLRTGDIGFIDSDGFVHIVDRIKELIKVKGSQVAPAELEGLLHGHHSVQDCAVLGVEDEYSGERPKAFVVLKDGWTPSAALGQELIGHVKARRVRYKWIKEVEFTDTVPKNTSGKILRRVLRERQRSGKRGFIVRDSGGSAVKL
ncbi:hypothetical protein BDV18DRAFT_150310 [Aspergillus unguis]